VKKTRKIDPQKKLLHPSKIAILGMVFAYLWRAEVIEATSKRGEKFGR
jgi:hypothetical protein